MTSIGTVSLFKKLKDIHWPTNGLVTRLYTAVMLVYERESFVIYQNAGTGETLVSFPPISKAEQF